MERVRDIELDDFVNHDTRASVAGSENVEAITESFPFDPALLCDFAHPVDCVSRREARWDVGCGCGADGARDAERCQPDRQWNAECREAQMGDSWVAERVVITEI